MKFVEFLLHRLKEPTTWGGISAVLTAIGVSIAPDLWEAIVAAGVAIGGVVMIVLREGTQKE